MHARSSRPRSIRMPALVAYGVATLAVPAVSVAILFAGPVAVEPVVASPPAAAVAESSPEEEAAEPALALAGIWAKHPPGLDGDPVAFYYFHGDGKGLYRYGRVGLSNTHSFDYTVSGGALHLAFRKTGAVHEIPYAVEAGEGGDWLVLDYDPEEQAHGTRYFRDHPGPIDPHLGAAEADLGPGPAGHMWIDMQSYATGGGAFGMYQFRPAGIDGRGVGWFHRGDFDDWSTESFTYRVAQDRLDLHFTLADRGEITTFTIEAGQPRTFRLQADPRDFWHVHSYDDMGVSFGSVPGPASMAALAGYSRTE